MAQDALFPSAILHYSILAFRYPRERLVITYLRFTSATNSGHRLHRNSVLRSIPSR